MEKTEIVSEGIDRLVTLDVSKRGAIYRLYEAARKLTSSPLTLTAAREIIRAIKPESYVLITTGFITLPNEKQETDGPLGAVALTRCLSMAFDVKPIIITERQAENVILSIFNAVRAHDECSRGAVNTHEPVLISDFPLKLKDAVDKAKSIIDQYEPSLILAVEKAGRNCKGEYHTMKGFNISPFHIKIEPLINEARNRGILTVAVGDGGNEIGMGNIKEAVEATVPYARKCRCPCNGGIAAESEADILVTATISNWGSYGVEACIAYLMGEPEIFHTPRVEKSMLKAAVNAGAVDGVTGHSEATVDGVSLSLHIALIKILRAIIS